MNEDWMVKFKELGLRDPWGKVEDFIRSQIQKSREEGKQEAVGEYIIENGVEKHIYDSVKYNLGFKSGLERAIEVLPEENMHQGVAHNYKMLAIKNIKKELE